MSAPRLRVTDLTVAFPAEDDEPVLAVDRLSFSLWAGEVLALVGESGCGKTVTALSILRLLPPSARVSGAVELEGRELTGLGPRQMREVRGRDVSMVFQEPMTSLNPSFTVGHQIAETIRRHQRLPRADAARRVVELLELVRMPAAASRARDYPHQLSGGMRQRVMIAMAVACDPRVLIADEPTTALDVTIQAQILDVMRDLRQRFGTSILLITHDLGVVADLADRVVVMYAGREVESSAVDGLFAQPQHPYTIGLLGAVPRPDLAVAGRGGRLREIPGLVPTLHAPPSACVFAPRCPRAAAPCASRVPELLEVAPGQRAACFFPGEKVAAGDRPVPA